MRFFGMSRAAQPVIPPFRPAGIPTGRLALATAVSGVLALVLLFPAGRVQAQDPGATPTPAATRAKRPARRAELKTASPTPATSPGTGASKKKGGGRSGATTAPAPSPAATPTGPVTRFRVTAETTPFFRLGPQQPAGPDLALKQDTRISMVKRGFGYSQVKLDDGMVGYVGNEDIKVLTAEEVANETSLTLTNTAAGPAGSAALFGGAVGPNGSARRRGPRLPALPLPPGAQEPSLPLPDLAPSSPTPKPQPTPAFRLNPD